MQRRQSVVNTLAFHHWVVGSVSGLDWHEVELLFSSHYLYGAPGNLGKKKQELRAGVDPMNFLSLLGTLNKWELAINPFPAKGFPIDE